MSEKSVEADDVGERMRLGSAAFTWEEGGGIKDEMALSSLSM